MSTLMKNGKFTCTFHMPKALTGEGTHRLPPCNPRKAYLVDEYPSCPTNWMRSKGRSNSYFVPVEEGEGMWLDFNRNSDLDRQVAIVISIQGINPITGLPCNDPQMEQYIDTCPKHKIEFGPDRYCKECGFKWPKQNYLCTTGTPNGLFWLDGFKSAEGIVRQYILTAEKMRGVAANVVGEDRVYAIGLSFFTSKEKKPEQPVCITRDIHHYTTHWYPHHYLDYTYTTCDTKDLTPTVFSNTSGSCNSNDTLKCCYASNTCSSGGTTSFSSPKKRKGIAKDNQIVTSALRSFNAPNVVQEEKLEVGAGAKIDQAVYDDPENLDFWHNEPEAIICINYCTQKDANKILEAGRQPIESCKDGFLHDIPVGN